MFVDRCFALPLAFLAAFSFVSPAQLFAGNPCCRSRCVSVTPHCSTAKVMHPAAVSGIPVVADDYLIRSVQGHKKFTHPIYGDEVFHAEGPQKTDGMKSCITLLNESLAAITLPPGSTEVCSGCTSASGCSEEFDCSPCVGAMKAPSMAPANRRFEVQWFGRCCDGTCIKGTAIQGANFCSTKELAKLSFCAEAAREGCPRVVRCWYRWKRL
jgi:hypothetical protein